MTKFSDWPDIKIHVSSRSHVDCNEILQIDGSSLYRTWKYEEPNLVLENSNLGRGDFYFDDDTRRSFEITSVSVEKWHASATGDQQVPTEDFCHFYSTECYTIRWVYQISITVRDLSGKVSTRTVGRDRFAYFNWQGCDASANERGISTLFMVEQDKEKGSQMIIQQFQETPAFVRLFKVMFIHKARDIETRHDSWRMYLVNGNDENESIALEVECHMKQLRSRGCILLIHRANGRLILWKGAKTTENQQKIALKVCSKICEFYSCDGIKLQEHIEGEESEEFLKAIGGENNDREVYGSLMNRDESFDFTPRMYQLTSKNGRFEAIQMDPGLRTKEFTTAFPFVQQDLYSSRQPTLFIVDNGYEIFLWQGWWPKDEEIIDQDEVDDLNNIDNRAGENRWHLEKCEAMQTTLDYWKEKCGNDEKYMNNSYMITAGFEPIEFQTIFPEWQTNEQVVNLNSEVRQLKLFYYSALSNVPYLKNPTKQPVQLNEYAARFKQDIYPLEVLLVRPLPEYINATKVEMYLSDEDFEKTLGLTKIEWRKLPLWKKISLRKDKGLF